MTSSIFHRSEPPGIVTSSASGKSGKSKQKDKTKTYSQRTLDPQIRDRSIFMGIRDREIRNGTTGYFGPLVEWGHQLYWGLALRGHGLFQCRISTGPKIILKYSGMGSWTIFSFSSLFHIKNTGPEQIYTTGLRFILEGDFNGAVENFWPSGYGAIHYLAW